MSPRSAPPCRLHLKSMTSGQPSRTPSRASSDGPTSSAGCPPTPTFLRDSTNLPQGISFYPQLLSNIKRRSVVGLALDYFVLNVTGFACYTISCIAFLFSPVVRKEYADRHPDAPEPTVRVNDLAFAAHAMVLSVITLSQFWTGLWGYERHPAQKMSKPVKAFVAGCFGIVWVSCACVDGDRWGSLDVVSAVFFCLRFFGSRSARLRALL